MKPYYQLKNDKVTFNCHKQKDSYDQIAVYEKNLKDSRVQEDYFENEYITKNKKQLVALTDNKRGK